MLSRMRASPPRAARLSGWILVLVALVSACSRSDASATSGHSAAAARTEPAADPEDGDPQLQDLERRAFPLLIWAAHTVAQEYFDTARIDPRGQLLSATTAVGLHTPEFFAEPAEDGALEVQRPVEDRPLRARRLAGLDDAADRLEEMLVFAQSVLDLEAEPLHELEYAAINGLFAPLDPHTIL